MPSFLALCLALLCSTADAYVAAARAAAPLSSRRAASAPAMVLEMPDLPAAATLIAEILDADGERVYGAVEAPGWVVPVGGLLAILTALLPVLLAPGDDAFQRQRTSICGPKYFIGAPQRCTHHSHTHGCRACRVPRLV